MSTDVTRALDKLELFLATNASENMHRKGDPTADCSPQERITRRGMSRNSASM